MERIKKEEKLNPSAKLHIIYGSIIMVMSVTFSVTLMTMNSTYKNKQGMPEMPPAMTEPAGGEAGGGMPSGAGGGMPPMVKKMVQDFKDAIAKNPKDTKALLGLANMYYDSGQYQKAITYYEQAVAVDEKNSSALSDLGTCYFYQKENEKAAKNFTLAIKVDEKNLNARYNLGLVYKAEGKKEEAKKEWEEMMKLLTTPEEKQKLQAIIDGLKNS